MNYFSKNKKGMAYLILLTFLFTSIMPSNLGGMNSVAEAAQDAFVVKEAELPEDAVEIQLQGQSTNNHFTVNRGWLTPGGMLYVEITVDNNNFKHILDFTVGGNNLGKIHPDDWTVVGKNGTVIVSVGNQLNGLISPDGLSISGEGSNDGQSYNSNGWDIEGMNVRLNGLTVLYLDIESGDQIHEVYTQPLVKDATYDVNAQKLDPIGKYTFVKDNGVSWSGTATDEDITIIAYYQKPFTLNGTKTWDDNNNQDNIRPESITVNLLADGEIVKTTTAAAANNWSWNFSDCLKYKVGGELIAYTVQEVDVDGYSETITGNISDGFKIVNKHVTSKVKVEGQKIGDDNNNQDGKCPESIIVNLFANGEKVDSQVVTGDNQWKYSFINLNEYKNGQKIVYTVSEDKVDGYTTKIAGTTITNIHTPETVTVEGTKTWDDNNNQDGIRPSSITVNLLADGAKVASKTVTANDTWKYNFTDLDKFKNGKEIVYTVAEEAVKGYKAEVDGYDITNTHTPEKTSVSGEKIWDDNNNQDGKRPENITVNLLANDTKVYSTTVTADTEWKYSFENLNKYAEGKEIAYTVEEVEVDGYESEITGSAEEGFVITNTHKTATTSISGTKTWDDNNNAAKARPNNITVNLFADGKMVNSVEVTSTNWNYEFTNLPVYRDGGIAIAYQVVEDLETAPGYVPAYSVEQVNGAYVINITNTYSGEDPAYVAIGGTKTWNDNNNELGKRPESITVNLLRDGVEIDEVTVTADNNWAYSFEKQPKVNTETSEAYVYTVTEDAVPEYRSVITKTASGYDITNTLITGEAGQIQVTKVVTGDNAPADGVFGFKLHIEASAPDWDAIDVYNKLQLEKAYEAAVEAYKAAKEAWDKAVEQFASSARELRTNGSAVQFVMKGESTTPSGYQYLMIDDAARITSTTSSSYFMDLDAGAADTGEGSIFAQVVDAIYNLAEDFSKANSVFLQALGEAVTTTPSALGFEQKAAQDLLNKADTLFEAKALMDSTSSSVLEFENSPEVTTPSAITLIVKDVDGKEVAHQNMFDEEGKYDYYFDLKDGQTYSFEVLATTGSTIKYWISEIKWVTENYEGTTVTMNGTDVTSSGNRFSGNHQLTTDSVYDFVFTNIYVDEEGGGGYNPWTPEPPKKPEPPKPPEIVIDDPEVPLDEPPVIVPGEEIPDPEIPLGDAPATGDAANAVPFMVLMMFALCGLVVTRRKFN